MESVPVYVNVFNRLTTTKILVEQIAKLDNATPIIIDNDSTYPPLLSWYRTAPCEVIRLKENLGHHAPWLSGVVGSDDSDYYCVTDCDLDLQGVPADVLTVLQSTFRWRRSPIKSGLALRVDDVPRTQTQVLEWESRWWRRKCFADPRFYVAAIDTTFAMYRTSTPHRLAMKVPGIFCVRLAGEYQARHVPWYCDPSRLTEEDQYYFASAGPSNSWRPGLRQLEQRL
jgi:hypothetical protein